jgi:hypothetical protein
MPTADSLLAFPVRQRRLCTLQQLVVNGNTRIDVAGPVVITVANGVNFNGVAGTQAHPEWLSLAVHSGGVTLNGTITFYGYVAATAGAVVINCKQRAAWTRERGFADT